MPVSTFYVGLGVLNIFSLRAATSLADVAKLLGFSPSGLSFVLYRQAPSAKYVKFRIPKKNGGYRDICAPIGAMKGIQRELATLLNACRAELLEANPQHPLSHGFREGLSIITNARNHIGRRYVLNLDLANFFPTFNFGRVRGFFIKDKNFQLHEKVATVLAQIACFENSLPQGSPCSPIIADMMGHLLDVRLVSLAKRHQVTYSRYADDLSFSTNQKKFPAALAKPDILAEGGWAIGEPLHKEIKRADFEINLAKTRMHFRGSRQTVTGLVVNTKVNVSQGYWRSIRSMCHSLYSRGEYYYPVAPKLSGLAGKTPVAIKNLAPLAGMMSHIYHVKQKSGQLPDKARPNIIFGHTDHKRFWFYKSFVAPTRPLILCEGVTDNIYLHYAIRHLAASYPKLGGDAAKGFQYRVAFFNYTNLAHKILDITGGVGHVVRFVRGYKKSLASYKNRPFGHPIIVVVDNDTGLSADVRASLKKSFGVDITHASTELFFHLTENLYLVKTPLVGKASISCIEDLFEDSARLIPLGGKVLHLDEKSFDPDKHIGKMPFATKIVKSHASRISWMGFAPLLDRISAVLDHHAALRTGASPSLTSLPATGSPLGS